MLTGPVLLFALSASASACAFSLKPQTKPPTDDTTTNQYNQPPSPSATQNKRYKVLLFDIEGTTTPISFVKDVLFPYVTAELETYLKRHYDEAETRADIQSLIDLSIADADGGVEGVVPIAPFPDEVTSEFRSSHIRQICSNVEWQMSSDRKSTPLKQLQGHMWKGGYENGSLKGQLFGGCNGDVVEWFRKWHSSGMNLSIYSSGSVEAQKLLFRFSEAGDLTNLLSSHFDTKVGMKQSSHSYARIADELKVSPRDILFLTDIYGEAAAAKASQVDSILLVRPGNYQLPIEQSTHPFPIAHNFEEVNQFIQNQPNHSMAQSSVTPFQSIKPEDVVDTTSGQYNTF